MSTTASSALPSAAGIMCVHPLARIVCVILLLQAWPASLPSYANAQEHAAILDEMLRLHEEADRLEQAGRHQQAIPLSRRALELAEQALGPDHLDVAKLLNYLAELYRKQGAYAEAAPLYQRSLRIREAILGPHDLAVAICLNNLALLYKAQGRYTEAEQLHERSFAIRVNALGPEHPIVAASLDNIAELYREQGRYSEAESLSRYSLRIREKVLDAEPLAVAISLNNLALLYKAQGRYAEAEQRHKRSLRIMEDKLGPEHPDLAANLNNLADLYREQGRYSEAEPLYLRSLRIWEEALGPEHPTVATSSTNLAMLFLAVEDIDRALDHANRAERILDTHLADVMALGNEKQRHQFMAVYQGYIDIGMTLAVQAPGRASALGLHTMLRNKGRVLDSMRSMLGQLRENLDDEGRELLAAYLDIRTAYASHYLRGSQGISVEQHRAKLAELESRKRDIEARLSDKSRRFEELNRSISLEDVRKALPRDTVLIEWLRYKPFDPKAAKPEDRWQAPHYAACLLPHGAPPACLDLGDADTIDNAAVVFHRALAIGVDADEQSRALYDMILAPLRPHLGEAKKLYLSPDAMLHFVPFAALVDRRTGRYLVEDYELTYVTSGRDLARTSPTDIERDPITIIGGPRYSLPGQEDSRLFKPLFGALREAQDIHALFPGSRLHTDLDATKAALQAVHAPRILHLPTHGYFGAQDCRGNPTHADNPLVAAGLALAGANACDAADERQGIITGEELAGLDLYGTELVVLSACDTGLGKLDITDDLSSQDTRIIGIRDGVYGLRRALVLAGAETQMVSMWKVDDAATRELMAAYYRALEQGAGRSQALRQVQLSMLHSENRAHPSYWASFVVIGNDAPLRQAASAPSTSPHSRGPRGCACQATAEGDPTPAGPWLLLAALLTIVLAGRVRCTSSRKRVVFMDMVVKNNCDAAPQCQCFQRGVCQIHQTF